MENQSNIRTLLQLILLSLTDYPDDVKIEVVVAEGEPIVFRAIAHPDDIGKIIGKQGRTARSIRTILSAASMRDKARYQLDIIQGPEYTSPDPERSKAVPRSWIEVPSPPAPVRAGSIPHVRR